MLARISALLRRPTSDLDPEQARSTERHRRAALTSLTGMAARGSSMGAALITIPLTLHYLGTERFGLWMTISSIIALAPFADFGIGNGVVNTVAAAHGRDDNHAIRRAVSSGFAILTAIAAVLAAGFLASFRLVDWARLLHVSSPLARAETPPAILAFALCILLNIPLDVVQRTQFGLQEGYRTNLWQATSSLLSLAGILLVVHLHGGVPALVAAFAGAPVLGVLLNSLTFFGLRRRDLFPSLRQIAAPVIRGILRLGILFFAINAVVAVTFSADNLYIAHFLGASSVAAYSVPQRMFSLIVVLATMLVAPLWPAYGEAVSRGDMPWVRRTLVRTIAGVFALTSLVGLFLVLFAQPILLHWVGPSVHPPTLLLAGLAAWVVLQTTTGTLQAFLNGAGILRFQVITSTIFGVVCLAAKLFLISRLGLVCVPWITFITYALLVVVPSAIYVPRLLARMTADSAIAAPATLEPEGF